MGTDRIEELKRKIADLERQWPKHSVPPALIQQLDDLEEELERELETRSNAQSKTSNHL